jgi:hypothetical protein
MLASVVHLGLSFRGEKTGKDNPGICDLHDGWVTNTLWALALDMDPGDEEEGRPRIRLTEDRLAEDRQACITWFVKRCEKGLKIGRLIYTAVV